MCSKIMLIVLKYVFRLCSVVLIISAVTLACTCYSCLLSLCVKHELGTADLV